MALRIMSVESGSATLLKIPLAEDFIYISALGKVATSGWTAIRLSPYFYIAPPSDGIWDLDVIGDQPNGVVLEILLPVTASGIFHAPAWCKGIRLHAGNMIEIKLDDKSKAIRAPQIHPTTRAAGRAIVNQSLASYEDSFQPTGTIHWHNDGPFGTPNPHVELKKLHHELTLIVEGPDEDRIRNCINQAIAAGLLAAIVAAFVTGGAALSAAVSAFLSTLTGCLGDGFTARIQDDSHWIYWDS